MQINLKERMSFFVLGIKCLTFVLYLDILIELLPLVCVFMTFAVTPLNLGVDCRAVISRAVQVARFLAGGTEIPLAKTAQQQDLRVVSFHFVGASRNMQSLVSRCEAIYSHQHISHKPLGNSPSSSP